MIYVFRVSIIGMRPQAEIEKELREKESMLGKSDKLDAQVRPYINALEWILEGDAEQVGAVRISKWNEFDEAILSARTNDDKIFISEKTDAKGVYSLLRYERLSGK